MLLETILILIHFLQNVKRAGAKPGQKGKKKKQTLRYTIDCTHPVEDGIMDVASFVRFHSDRVGVGVK